MFKITLCIILLLPLNLYAQGEKKPDSTKAANIASYYLGNADLEIESQKKRQIKLFVSIESDLKDKKITLTAHRDQYLSKEEQSPEKSVLTKSVDIFVEKGSQASTKFEGVGKLEGEFGDWKKWVIKRNVTSKSRKYDQVLKLTFFPTHLDLHTVYLNSDKSQFGNVKSRLKKVSKEEYNETKKNTKVSFLR